MRLTFSGVILFQFASSLFSPKVKGLFAIGTRPSPTAVDASERHLLCPFSFEERFVGLHCFRVS